MRLFDMHCDTLYECCQRHLPLTENTLQLDLKRGRRYERWAQVFAVWMPDTLRGEAAYAQCCDMLTFAHEAASRQPQTMRIVRDGADFDEAFADGCCAAVLAVEGGAALAGQLGHIDDLAARGVKIITVTWNGSNELGHGSGSGYDEGLTPFGKAAVRRMEEKGILPDVSHLNERGFWDVVETATGPFIASHSVSAAVHPHARNLTDAQFAAIRDRGGVVGLNLCDAHLGGATFEQLERHLDHYLALGGEGTVGFGCDFDGTDLPTGWGGIEVMERIYAYLLHRNYEEALLTRLFFGNCVDFFTSALTRGKAMY